MINYKKLFGIISIILGLLLLGGCYGDFNSPLEKNAGKESVLVSISLNSEGRTLLPGASVFDKYLLTFTANSGQTEPEVNPVELLKDQLVLELELGSWTLNVVGMVWIENISGITDGYYEAASSKPVNFTASTNSSNIVYVIVRGGIQEGVKGLFSWDISFPDEVIAGSFVIQDIFEQSIDGVNPVNLINENNRTGTIALNPGYYFLKTELENEDNNKAYRTEIFHIYSGLTTVAGSGNGYAFSSANFAPMVTINGKVIFTALVSLNPQGTLALYRDSEYTQKIADVSLDASGNWNYRISPLLYKNLYIKTVVTYEGFEPIEKTKGPIAITSVNEDDWVIDVSLLHLTGSLLLDSLPVLTSTLSLYSDLGYSEFIINADIDINGNWTALMLPVYTNVYLKALIMYDGYSLQIERIKGPVDVNSGNEADWIINCLLPNSEIIISDPTVKLYLNNTTLLENNVITNMGSVREGVFTVSIDPGSYSEIRWFVNGNLAAQGNTRTLIGLSLRNAGVLQVTVEATPSGRVKNTGTHSFEIVE